MAQQNMTVETKGKMLLISIDTSIIVSESGTPLKIRKPGDDVKLRVNDLIATSGGFLQIPGGYTVSLNVNRDPAMRPAVAATA
jgi:hypothetical protein